MTTGGGAALGRLFPELAPCLWPEATLRRLADAMWVPDGPEETWGEVGEDGAEAHRIPAGYTYLGQFINHDLSLEGSAPSWTPAPLETFASRFAPRFDLEVIYGGGPRFQPALYGGPEGNAFRLAPAPAPPGQVVPIPAVPDHGFVREDKLALLADMRSDENLMIAQIAQVWMRLHNRLLGEAEGDGPLARFAEARRLTSWHFQRMVVDDYLPRICRREAVEQALMAARGLAESGLARVLGQSGPAPSVPVELIGAVFRFGHSMVRPRYNLNAVNLQVPPRRLLRLTGVGGEVPVTADWLLDWRRFFPFGGEGPPINAAKPIDTLISPAFRQIHTDHGDLDIILVDLQRSQQYSLPSGQAVAQALGMTPLTPEEIAAPDPEAPADRPRCDQIAERGAFLLESGLAAATPLYYYVLREAALQEGGARLGAVGSWVMASVLVGLLAADEDSYLRRAPDWQPTIPMAVDGRLAMADVIAAAGPIAPISDPDWPL